MATFATLFFVPVVYSLLTGKAAADARLKRNYSNGSARFNSIARSSQTRAGSASTMRPRRQRRRIPSMGMKKTPYPKTFPSPATSPSHNRGGFSCYCWSPYSSSPGPHLHRIALAQSDANAVASDSHRQRRKTQDHPGSKDLFSRRRPSQSGNRHLYARNGFPKKMEL